MKKVFIYYSETGCGDLIAEQMSKQGYEIVKVFLKRKPVKSFFFHMLGGGFAASVKASPKIENDLSKFDYEEVVIGSPIWNDRISAPINTVLKSVDLSNKKVKFILYSGGGEANHAVARIQKEYPNATYVILKQPTKYPDELTKL